MPKNFKEDFTLTTEAINEEQGIISGVALVYDQETRNGTAYDNKVKFKETLPLLFNHDVDDVIGNVNYEKSDKGVNFKAKLNLNVKHGAEVWEHIKAGDLDGVSIGAFANSYEWDEALDIIKVSDYELIELSVVTVPSNPNARIKTKEDFENEFKNIKKETILSEDKEEKKEVKKMSLSEKIDAVNNKKRKLTSEKNKVTRLLESINDSEDLGEIEELKTEKTDKEKLIEQLSDEIAKEEAAITTAKEQLEKAKESASRSNILENKEFKVENNGKGDYTRETFINSKRAKDLFEEAFVMTKKDGKKFSENYKTLLAKEGFTGDVSDLFPTNSVTEITDKMRNAGTLMPFINRITGVENWKALVNKSEELGYGHAGNSAEKVEQNNELSAVDIVTQYVYKYIKVPREMLNQPNDVLYNYIITELAQRLVLTLERAIVTGDGLLDEDGKKITSFKPMLRTTSNDFVTVVSEIKALNGDTLDLLNAEIIEGPESMTVAVMSKKTYSKLKTLRDANGNRSYERSTVVIEGKTYNKLDEVVIVIKEFVDLGTIVMFDNKAYTMISYETDAEMLMDFELKTNTREFLTEIAAGGDVTHLSSVAIATVTDPASL